jgi:hypothetical protein
MEKCPNFSRYHGCEQPLTRGLCPQVQLETRIIEREDGTCFIYDQCICGLTGKDLIVEYHFSWERMPIRTDAVRSLFE